MISLHARAQVGKHHEISAGLLIGGKDVKEEQSSVSSMNILVATPGRLLQVRGGKGELGIFNVILGSPCVPRLAAAAAHSPISVCSAHCAPLLLNTRSPAAAAYGRDAWLRYIRAADPGRREGDGKGYRHRADALGLRFPVGAPEEAAGIE